MKELAQGNMRAKPWWVGYVARCPGCQRIVEMEEHDDDSVNVFFRDGTLGGFVCPRCKTTVLLGRGEPHRDVGTR